LEYGCCKFALNVPEKYVFCKVVNLVDMTQIIAVAIYPHRARGFGLRRLVPRGIVTITHCYAVRSQPTPSMPCVTIHVSKAPYTLTTPKQAHDYVYIIIIIIIMSMPHSGAEPFPQAAFTVSSVLCESARRVQYVVH